MMVKTAKDGSARRYPAAALVLALSLMLATASAARAAPKGIFAKFAQCPTGKANVALCQYLEVTGGTFSIGRTSISIERPIVMQGGAVHTGGPNPNEYFLVPALNGQSISANELKVSGSLSALLGCLQDGCSGQYGATTSTTVIASIELATSASHPAIFNVAAAFMGEGPAAILPVRVHLHNQLLGSACYLGSTAHPIELRLTDGATRPPPPNKAITGTLGVATEEEEYEHPVTSVTGVTLLDNAFSVPVAAGCGGSLAFLVDTEIDHALGLESPAGRNAAIMNMTLSLATAANVVASEAFPGK